MDKELMNKYQEIIEYIEILKKAAEKIERNAKKSEESQKENEKLVKSVNTSLSKKQEELKLLIDKADLQIDYYKKIIGENDRLLKTIEEMETEIKAQRLEIDRLKNGSSKTSASFAVPKGTKLKMADALNGGKTIYIPLAQSRRFVYKFFEKTDSSTDYVNKFFDIAESIATSDDFYVRFSISAIGIHKLNEKARVDIYQYKNNIDDLKIEFAPTLNDYKTNLDFNVDDDYSENILSIKQLINNNPNAFVPFRPYPFPIYYPEYELISNMKTT